MDNMDEKLEHYNRQEAFIEKLLSNQITVPNEFTEEMGKLIKAAREEKGFSQTELAQKLSKRQATISDFENGKIDIGIMTLVHLAIVFGKPISYFIPAMKFLVSLGDIHNKWEEEALALYRELEYQGDPELARRFMKMLLEYNIEQQDPDWGIPDEDE